MEDFGFNLKKSCDFILHILSIPVKLRFLDYRFVPAQGYAAAISSTIASTARSGSAAALMGRPITR